MGTPEMRYFFIISWASTIFWSGSMVMGSMIIPLSDFFTLSTSMAWASMDRFLCIIPIPPSRAMVIAVLASVTVSIAALKRGIFKVILLVKIVLISTSFGTTSDLAGTSKTSSKVKHSWRTFSNMISPS
jgi:hypothetical protein